MASLEESQEARSPVGPPPGDNVGIKYTAAAARAPTQGEEASGGGEDWSTIVKKKARKLGGGPEVADDDSTREQEEVNSISRLARRLREEDKINPKRVMEIREAEWECKDQQCKWRNFSGRKVCMKCLNNSQGLKTPAQDGSEGAPVVESALERTRRIGERGEASRRHQKVLVLTINLLIEDKKNRRPPVEDHYNILKQAGLNLAEVKGKVGKHGYLEVALLPGAASAAGALREVSKIVDERITILSVREQGSSREVLVRWQEVPFGTLDETLY